LALDSSRETVMARRKQRALARNRTASKRGKARTKVNSAPRKSAKRTKAKASAKKAAPRVAVKTKTKKQAVKPRSRRTSPKKAAPQPTELAGRPAEAAEEAVIVDIIEAPVAGAVVVTEFESVRISESEAPGPQHDGKDSSERGEHLH
jgi:hypothetical protein